MSVVTVSEVVEAFSPAFNSVDLRIVAVKPGDEWINVITSLFPSSKSQEETESEQQQSRDKLPNTDRFCILLTSIHFKQLRTLFKAFKKGEIKVSNTLIKLRGFDPSELRVDSFLPSYLKEMEEWRLVGSQAMAQTEDRRNLWPIVDGQNGTARLLGYRDIYELIGEILRIREFGRGTLRDFVIGIPIHARITNVSLIGSSLKIKTKKDSGLKDLQLNLYHQRYYPRIAIGYETVWRTTGLVKECRRPPARKFCYVTNSIQLTDLRPHDMIVVELIHRQAPTLNMDSTHLLVPLENPVEPFAKALNSFCSLEIFRERLLNPEKCIEDRTRPNTIFENAVAWLLSLVGFSVLPLGRRFERLKVPKTGYEVGSIDIIAYRENECVLLVDCDTKIPDDKKIRSMMTIKEHFRPLQDEYRRPNIISAIFSPKDCTGISVDRQHVKIVDRPSIKHIFEEAMKGDLNEARSSLVY